MLDRMLFSIVFKYFFKRSKEPHRAWKLYDGVTIPRKEDLILVGNPDKRTSKLVYTLADQAEYRILDICEIPFVTLATTRTILDVLLSAEYRMLDISEIPFVTLATTRTIINGHRQMDFDQQSNNTFEAAPRSQIQTQTRPVISTPSVIVTACQPKHQAQPPSASPVAACIAAVTSYFDFTSPSGHTAQKRSRENAFEEDQDIEVNPRQRRRFGSPWLWSYSRTCSRLRVLRA